MLARTRFAVVCGLGLLSILAGRAFGETRFSLSPLAQVSEGYNDNITLVANHHLGDFVTTGVTGFSLNWGGGPHVGSLEYDTVFQTFASHSEFNSYATTNFVTIKDVEALSPSLTMDIYDSVVTGNITGGLLLGDTGAISTQVAQSAVSNSSTTSNSFTLGLNKRISEAWTGHFDLFQNFYSYGVQSACSQGGVASLLYAIRPQVRTGLSYTFDDFRFNNVGPSEAHTVEVPVLWDPTPRIKLTVEPGVVAIDNFGASFLVRPAGYGSIEFLGERWTIRGSGGQAASTTGGLGGAGLVRDVSGVITYALRRHTFLTAGGSYTEFVGGGSNGSFVSYGMGLADRPRRWLTLFAQYQGFQDSVSSSTTGVATPFGVTPGTTAISNSIMLGLKVAVDVYDISF